MGIDAQLFADLPPECGIRCLSGLDLAAGKLPQSRGRLAWPDTAFGRESEGCRVVKRLLGNNSGNSLGDHVLTEIAAKEAGVRWSHIAYQGSGPGVTALLGGHVDMASSAVGPVQAHIKAGTLRPLAVYSETRMKAYPDVPTLKELGYNVASPVVYGLLAPKGTPREVVDALYGALKKVTAKYSDQIAVNLAVSGAELRLMGPEEYAAHLRAQQKLYSDAVRHLDLIK